MHFFLCCSVAALFLTSLFDLSLSFTPILITRQSYLLYYEIVRQQQQQQQILRTAIIHITNHTHNTNQNYHLAQHTSFVAKSKHTTHQTHQIISNRIETRAFYFCRNLHTHKTQFTIHKTTCGVHYISPPTDKGGV